MKRLVRSAFNMLGLDVRRQKYNPGHTLLGLRQLPIKTVIDIGANTGQFAKSISRLYPTAQIICFEPLPDPFRELNAWAQTDKRISAINAAIGDSEYETSMYCHLAHTPSSSLLTTTDLNHRIYPFTKKQVQIPVQVTTLDKALESTRVDLIPDVLIKLDVQGYEDRAIRGGLVTFSRSVACIVEVSIDRLYAGQARFKDLLAMLERIGFDYAGNMFQSCAEDGHVIYFDAVFRRR